MTRKRYDAHSTEFGLWLREQTEIDSSLGFIATNIDYIWMNYKNGKFMFIEEKRYGSKPAFWQEKLFRMMHEAFKGKENYYGFNLIVFENTNPEDGKMYLNNKEISKNDLIRFLTFS
ncbi:hypothetical protein KKH23_07190 [Patescibacteria group bacterium]|nr:hypothetical protein [Patescibacteria group bacterium]MBU0846961.1 hypothetical protein [Patescibacteria group bacterium]